MKYNIIYADPPWSFKIWSPKGDNRSASQHYMTMDFADICSLPIDTISADDSILFLWATNPLLQYAFDLIRAWEFEYKTVAFTWAKKNKIADTFFMGLGYWTRANTELCLLATKGHPTRISMGVSSLVISPIEKHSQKPAIVRDRIVQLCGDLPRIELFARQKAPGWDCIGYDIDGKDINESIQKAGVL